MRWKLVLMIHPESIVPFCVREFRILDDYGNELAHCADNHQTRFVIQLDKAVVTDKLHVELKASF